jgi:hypothetical protein
MTATENNIIAMVFVDILKFISPIHASKGLNPPSPAPMAWHEVGVLTWTHTDSLPKRVLDRVYKLAQASLTLGHHFRSHFTPTSSHIPCHHCSH